ncbi:hypothetical protein [Prauserella muralis]|uniref:Uncharacterized protein n=1 Tax=Prauserella muralis TaxID=588067 RepID=A0A2V4AP28_9PSEU|nr:hypothetical protein [Prauserella muralis]PXY22456.1 hypothetical protein BAY60_21645 [Prauserella muralis]TWE28132.1 hypothetical protein FHX69_0783 [Prauserella muralis]
MATRKVTLSLDAGALEFAERAAKAHGVSVSSWLSKAARREAVRTGYRPHGAAQAEGAARHDEAEIAAALEDLRAEG